MTLDLDAIRARAQRVAAWAHSADDNRLAKTDVPALIAEVERLRREGICGDRAPALIRTDDGEESGAGVICELTHGHTSEWHEARDELGPPMRWRPASVTISAHPVQQSRTRGGQ